MTAGAYATPVVLEQPVRTQNADGSAALVYLDAGPDFAAIRLLTQNERLRRGRLEGVASHEIRLRHREDVIGGWHIRAGQRRFRVLASADPDARRRTLVCLCEEEER